jgi:hypothetical protein
MLSKVIKVVFKINMQGEEDCFYIVGGGIGMPAC